MSMFDCWFDDILAWFKDQLITVGASVLLAGYAVLGLIAPEQIQTIELDYVMTILMFGTAPTLFLLVSYTPLVQLWWAIERHAPMLPDPDTSVDEQRLRRHAVAWTLILTASAAFGTALRAFM